MVVSQSLYDVHDFIHSTRGAPFRFAERLNPIPSELQTMRRGQPPT